MSFTSLVKQFIRHNCYRASIYKNPRSVYARLYPVLLIKPDGSTIRINYNEPISFIRMPFDVNTLNEIDRKKRLLKRQMATKKAGVSSEDDIINFETESSFNQRQYIKKK